MQNDYDRAAKLVPLRVAAGAYGVSKEALRRRIHRGELEHRTDNHGRLLVPLPANVVEEVDTKVPPKRRQPDAEDVPTVAALRRELATTREQVVRLEERLGFAEELKAELRRQVEQARADLERERRRADESERRQAELDRRLDEVLRHLGELREERRRPWPGLRAWWRRLVEGGG